MPIGVDVNNQKDIQVAQLNLQKLNIDYNNKMITSPEVIDEAFIAALTQSGIISSPHSLAICGITSR
jgi:hypothetical protein